MSDITNRLRNNTDRWADLSLMRQAADEIDSLRAELAAVQQKYETAVDMCNVEYDHAEKLQAELDAAKAQRDAAMKLNAEQAIKLDVLLKQEPIAWGITDKHKAVSLTFSKGFADHWKLNHPDLKTYDFYAAPVATPAPCATCDELRDNLSDALGGRLHTDDEKARMIDGLLEMIGRISDALGISKEDQSVASGDEEILFAIEELKAATPAPVAQKVSMPTAKGWKCHCCGFDGLDNQQYNRFCAQCRRSR